MRPESAPPSRGKDSSAFSDRSCVNEGDGTWGSSPQKMRPQSAGPRRTPGGVSVIHADQLAGKPPYHYMNSGRSPKSKNRRRNKQGVAAKRSAQELIRSS